MPYRQQSQLRKKTASYSNNISSLSSKKQLCKTLMLQKVKRNINSNKMMIFCWIDILAKARE